MTDSRRKENRTDMSWTAERRQAGPGSGSGSRSPMGILSFNDRLTSANSCMRRWLRRQRHSLWMLLAILVIGLTIQLLITSPGRAAFEFPAFSDIKLPVPRNFWNDSELQKAQDQRLQEEKPIELPPEEKKSPLLQDIKPPQEEDPRDLDPPNEGLPPAPPRIELKEEEDDKEEEEPQQGGDPEEPQDKEPPPFWIVDKKFEQEPQNEDLPFLLVQPAEDTNELHPRPPRIEQENEEAEKPAQQVNHEEPLYLLDQQNPKPPQDGGLVGLDHRNAGAIKLSFNKNLKSWNIHFQNSCDPKSHIVFLKTHKTAGSTIQNILYRFGERRNLTFALPRNKHNQLSYPLYFDPRFVEGVISKRTTHFDIMCNHMRFRKSAVKKLMPEDSFYFSILRHPVTMMESLFTYYKGFQVFKGAKILDDLFNNNVTSSKNTQNQSLSMTNNYAHNNLAFDFGYDNTLTVDTADLEKKANVVIAGIERDFHLILINEYFDESMILLKHALCWSLVDVASFKLNSRDNQTRKPISPTTAEKVKRWNALDWRIYLHFNATFWQHMRSVVGEEALKREVSELRELQAKLTSTCLQNGQAVHPKQIKDSQLKPFQYGAAVIQGYILNPNLDTQTKATCQRFITPELQYTRLLYDQQFPPKPLPTVKHN